MSDIKTFAFEDHLVRVVMRDGDPWFVVKDVCSVLSIQNAAQAVESLDEDEKGICSVYTLGGQQDAVTVSESGMYTLVLRSRSATTPGSSAHRFRKWVTGDVLPQIRKTGRYEAKAPQKLNASPAKIKAVKMRFVHAVSDLEDLGVDVTTIDMKAVQEFAKRHLGGAAALPVRAIK